MSQQTKKVYFYIDDVIWVLRDLNRERPHSLFDNAYMKMLKTAHDRYGMKVQLNLFYRTDFFYGGEEFTLADMTDAYKEEWKAASSWLKLSFHAKQEFPDFPYLNADYADVKRDFESVRDEVIRFAGEDTFTYATIFHWNVASKDACRALKDCGVKLFNATHSSEVHPFDGDPASLPYGHMGRLLQNRKPETAVYRRDTRDKAIANSICGYNHITDEQYLATKSGFGTVYDEETGLHFKCLGEMIVNLWPLEEVKEGFAAQLYKDCLSYGIHEQYFYPDYYAYQPDYAEKIYAVSEAAAEAGCEFIFAEDILSLQEK